MNIDDEIKKLNKERDTLLIEVVEKRVVINELARKIRSLETVKRHASEILNSKASQNIALTKGEESDELIIKDPAQLDLEVDDLTPVENALGVVDPAKDEAIADAKSNTEAAIEKALEPEMDYATESAIDQANFNEKEEAGNTDAESY